MAGSAAAKLCLVTCVWVPLWVPLVGTYIQLKHTHTSIGENDGVDSDAVTVHLNNEPMLGFVAM